MSTALVPARERNVCGECGATLVCGFCSTGDVVQDARRALAEVVKGVGGRNAMARIMAAKVILAKDFLAYLTDEDLLAEVNRRRGAKRP